MKIRITLLVMLSLCVAPMGRPMAAEAIGERVALVIGNAKYPDSEKPLKEPVNDARDLADELKRDGFDVDLGENLSIDGMRRAFQRLYARVKPGSVALVFFSGFGIQSGRQSYMIPVDAQLWTEPDVRRDGFSLETVLGEINSRGAAVKIALIDASRRNPYERRFRSFSAGLAPIIAPAGTLVMYSAALSSVVSDNGGDHSLFVGELLKEIRVPGLTAEETLNRTRVGVTRASRSEQVPWISSSLADEFSFVPAKAPRDTVADKPPATEIAKTEPAKIEAAKPPPKVEAPKPIDIAKEPAKVAAKEAPKNLPPEPVKETIKDSVKEAKQPPREPVKEPVQEIAKAPTDNKESDAVTPPASGSADESRLELALATDPTVRTLTDKISDNPDDGNARYRRGQVYASKGAYRLALNDFDEAIRINPKDVEAYNNRCWVRTVVDDLAAALKDCNEALRLRPNFVDALDSRGLLNLKNGQTKNAIADFDAALKINPRLTSSLYGRGLAKQRRGLTSEAEIDIANAKSMDPNIVQEFAGYGVR